MKDKQAVSVVRDPARWSREKDLLFVVCVVSFFFQQATALMVRRPGQFGRSICERRFWGCRDRSTKQLDKKTGKCQAQLSVLSYLNLPVSNITVILTQYSFSTILCWLIRYLMSIEVSNNIRTVMKNLHSHSFHRVKEIMYYMHWLADYQYF